MPNTYFKFKQFTIHHDRCAMKVTTDACVFGAWCAGEIQKSKLPVKTALDIGTGTGLLSLMVEQKNDISIDAIEIDKDAAEQAKENVTSSPWKEKIKVVHADILKWETPGKYDCIISNPPFYESELKSDKATKNIAHHDEGLKLDDLFDFIKKHLAAEGKFFLLLPAKRENDLDLLLKRYEFYLHQKIILRQSEIHPAFRLMIQAGNKIRETITTNELVIKNKSNEYTPAFVALLKDYYLYL